MCAFVYNAYIDIIYLNILTVFSSLRNRRQFRSKEKSCSKIFRFQIKYEPLMICRYPGLCCSIVTVSESWGLLQMGWSLIKKNTENVNLVVLILQISAATGD